MRARTVLSAAALLLALPAPAAADLDAPMGLHADGPGTVEAQMALWIVPSSAAAEVHLSSAALFGEANTRQFVQTSQGRLLLPNPEVKGWSDTGVQARLTPWQAGRMAVWPSAPGSARLVTAFDGLDLVPEPPQCVRVRAGYSAPSGQCLPLQDAAQLKATADGPVRIEGDLKVVLWGWNITAEGSEGFRDWSGIMSPRLGGPSQARELLLHLEGAVLEVPASALSVSGAIVEEARLTCPGSLTFPHRLLRSPCPVSVVAAPGRLLVEMPVAATEAAPAGRATEWVAAALLGAGLLAAGILVAYLLRRPRDPVLRALRQGDSEKAARIALRQGPAQTAEEAAVRTVAFLQAGDLDAAERQLVSYALPAAEHRFLMATVRARQGRSDEARALLAESIRLNPAFRAEADLNPDLARLDTARPPQPEGYG